MRCYKKGIVLHLLCDRLLQGWPLPHPADIGFQEPGSRVLMEEHAN